MKEDLWNEWRDIIVQEFNIRLTAMGTKGNMSTLGRKGITALFVITKDMGVSADEILPLAIKTLKDKDTKDPNKVGLLSSDEVQNDDLALIGHRMGMFENGDYIEKYLQDVNQVTKPKGQMLFTSIYNNAVDKPKQLSNRNSNSGRYTGNSGLQFQYRELMGPYFGIFHLDAETLRNQAARSEWQYVVVYQEDKNNFVALLKHNE